MLRSIAIGLAAATIAMGGSTLIASSAPSGQQQSGISKGQSHRGMSRSGGAYGYETEREGGITRSELNEVDRGSNLSPRERDHVRSVVREGFAELSPREREYLRGAIRERIAELSPRERNHLRGVIRDRLAELSPRERVRVKRMLRHHLARNAPTREREDLSRIERERGVERRGAYGRRY